MVNKNKELEKLINNSLGLATLSVETSAYAPDDEITADPKLALKQTIAPTEAVKQALYFTPQKLPDTEVIKGNTDKISTIYNPSNVADKDKNQDEVNNKSGLSITEIAAAAAAGVIDIQKFAQEKQKEDLEAAKAKFEALEEIKRAQEAGQKQAAAAAYERDFKEYEQLIKTRQKLQKELEELEEKRRAASTKEEKEKLDKQIEEKNKQIEAIKKVEVERVQIEKDLEKELEKSITPEQMNRLKEKGLFNGKAHAAKDIISALEDAGVNKEIISDYKKKLENSDQKIDKASDNFKYKTDDQVSVKENIGENSLSKNSLKEKLLKNKAKAQQISNSSEQAELTKSEDVAIVENKPNEQKNNEVQKWDKFNQFVSSLAKENNIQLEKSSPTFAAGLEKNKQISLGVVG